MESAARAESGVDRKPLEITPAILSLVAALDEFKGAWRAVGRIAPERLGELRRHATIQSVGATLRTGGAATSDEAVERLLGGAGAPDDAPDPDSRDAQVAAGCAAVLEAVFAKAGEIDLTEDHIRELHRDLLQFSVEDELHRGAYKTRPNPIEATGTGGASPGIVVQTPGPLDTPQLMKELVEWTRLELAEGALHPLLVIAVFIVVFLEIRPFQHYNGPLSRVLTTLLLLRAGYAYVPYASLDRIIEEKKQAYSLALRQTQVTVRTPTPDLRPWLTFFLDALREQQQRLEAQLEHERTLRERLPELSLQLLDLCRKHERLTVASAVEHTGANRNTVKDHLSRLTKAGHLARNGAGRGTWYAPA